MAKGYVDAVNALFVGGMPRPERVQAELLRLRQEGHDLDELYADVSRPALEGLYRLREQVQLERSLLEHLVYRYFLVNLLPGTEPTPARQEALDELLAHYRAEPSLELEAILVQLVKQDRLDDAQVERVEEACTTREMTKQLLLHRIRAKLQARAQLTREEVRQLLDVRGYAMLKLALEQGGVVLDALIEFRPPVPGERDRKHIEELHQLASR